MSNTDHIVAEQPLVAPSVTGAMQIIKIAPSAATGALQEHVTELTERRIDAQDSSQMLEAFILRESSAKAGHRVYSLKEAATMAGFPALLRTGMQAILFDTYNETPSTFRGFVKTVTSNNESETWVEGNQLGLLPEVAELNPYPEVDANLDRALRIVNTKRGMIFGVSEEMWKFDKLNMIRQYPENLGRAARLTQEQAAYSVLRTTGNYVRNSTTADNDIGANTATATFGAATLNTAIATLATMRDRKSGTPLNVNPNTLIVPPRLSIAARQLVLSPILVRASANNAAEVYGTGQTNGFNNVVDTVIVSPFMGGGSLQYDWALMERGKAIVYQEVEPLQMLTAGMDASNLTEQYFVYDKIRYRVRIWFGCGMLNDRFAYYSDSNTAPTIG